MIEAEFFLGRWRMERRIDDRRAGLVGRMAGEAVFSQGAETPARLDYSETGMLDYGGRQVSASQRYAWVFAAPERVEILNSGGETLCAITLGEAAPENWARHLCGDDVYETRLEFGDGFWRQIWRVAGPRKDYVSDTVFRRAGEE